jgi:hypothetical protein
MFINYICMGRNIENFALMHAQNEKNFVNKVPLLWLVIKRNMFKILYKVSSWTEEGCKSKSITTHD